AARLGARPCRLFDAVLQFLNAAAAINAAFTGLPRRWRPPPKEIGHVPTLAARSVLAGGLPRPFRVRNKPWQWLWQQRSVLPRRRGWLWRPPRQRTLHRHRGRGRSALRAAAARGRRSPRLPAIPGRGVLRQQHGAVLPGPALSGH